MLKGVVSAETEEWIKDLGYIFSEKQITNAKFVGVFMNGEDIHIHSGTISKHDQQSVPI